MSELELLSSGASIIMQNKGIQRGTRVLLMARPGVELIACVFALFKLGAPPVVIDPGMGLKGFLRCVAHARPEALVGIPLAHWVSRFFPRSFRSVRTRVVVNKGFLFKASQAGKQPINPAATTRDELAAILFTSGSTGPAKGVCYEHGMFEAQVRMLREHFAIQPGEIDLPMLPIFALFNPALGMTTIVPQMNPSRPAKADPAKIVAAIQQHKVTNSFGSPVLWRKITDYCEANGKTLPSLKRVLMAGAPCPPALIRRLKALMPNGEVHTPYGATEVLPVSSISGTEILKTTAALTEQGHGTCVGQLLPGVQAKIIAIDDGPLLTLADTRELPPGEIGEIVVTGPSVTKAYDKLPEATKAAKVFERSQKSKVESQKPEQSQSPANLASQTKNYELGTKNYGGSTATWHRMGDIGYFDTEGRLWFCGRKAERVETADGPLYTDCVEGIFNTHPDVFRTALLGPRIDGEIKPILAIEPLTEKWPHNKASRTKLTEELLSIGSKHPHTSKISEFWFLKHFPVDVRHNAKINRLIMMASYEADHL